LTDRRPDPEDLTPREALERYLRRRQSESTDKTVKGIRYRMKLFVEWCQVIGIDRIGELTGYDLDEFYEQRAAEVAPATLEGQMWTLRMFVEFLEDIGAVEDGDHLVVAVPEDARGGLGVVGKPLVGEDCDAHVIPCLGGDLSLSVRET